MENSWQNKCGSMWQHSPPVGSSLHESHTQFFNADHHLCLQSPQESMLLTHGTSQEHVVPRMPGFYNLGHADCGDSFLSLLSGPLAQVPCDLLHISNQKPVPVSSQVPTNSRTLNGFSVGSRVSLLPGALWPQNMTCQTAKSGEVFLPLISSNSNAGNSSTLLQAACLNFQKSSAVACQNPLGNDTVKNFSPLIGNSNAGAISSNTGKLQNYGDNTDSRKVPLDSNFSACHHVHTPSSSFPRVFCSGLSGHLLLSDTGLLGIVCSCHGLYMSISKFSEHSDSSDVNPGNSVHMDNGETVAQWRKTFLAKSGIRILEGQREWDWPEGISVASGLAKHPISKSSNDTVLLNPVGPYRDSVNYGQLQYSVINSKDNHSCGNAVDEFLFCHKERTSQECSGSLFKNLIGSCQGNLQSAAHRQIIGMPGSVGIRSTDKISQSTAAKVSTCETESVLLALPGIQNLKIPCNGFCVSRNTSSIVDGLGASSNIELRLGQPPELSRALETLVAPGFESYLKDMHTEPQKVFLSDWHLQKCESRELHGTEQTLQFADIASNPCKRRGPMQSNHSNYVGGAYGAVDGDMEMTHINPLLFPCFKNPEAEWQFRTTNDIGNISHIVAEKLHCESHPAKSERICFPWSTVAGDIKECYTHVSNAQSHVHEDKEVERAVNDLLGAAKSKFEFPKTLKEDLSNVNAVLGASSYNYYPAFYGKSPNAFQMSAMIADEPHGRDTLKNSLKNSSLSDIQHFNCDPVRPIPNSTIAKEKISLGLPSKISALVQRTISLSTKYGSGINPGLLDENLKMPAVQNLLESSIRDHAPRSIRNFLDCEILNNPWEESLLTIAPSTSKDHAHVPDCFSIPKIPEVGANSSGTICWIGNDGERFGTMTGRSLYAEDAEMQCQLSCNLHPIDRLLVRPGGSESNFTHSKKEQCFQGLPHDYEPEKCSSGFHANCLNGKRDINGYTYCNLLKEGDGSANGAITSRCQPKLNEKTGNLVAQNVQKVESHSFQWRDVPRKITESCSLTGNELQASSFNGNGNLRSPVASVAKCFTKSARHVREHEISNASSGCSAPDVTQASIEVDEKDSSTIDGGDIRCANNLIMDEGSRNERSWSSDLDNEHCTEFFGSASRTILVKRRPFKTVHRKHKSKLLMQKFEVGSKTKKAVKWMKLDASFPASGQFSINNESPNCTEEVGQNAHLVWDMQMQIGCDKGSPGNCAGSIEQNFKQRRSAFSASKGISLKRDLHRVYHPGEQATEAQKSSGVDDKTLEALEMFRKKKLKLNNASATTKLFHQICCSNAEGTANFTSGDCLSHSLGKPVNFYKWMARPIVFGKYGIISNGNLSKPTKIHPLKMILKNAAHQAEIGDRNTTDNCENDKVKSASVKVKKTKVRQMSQNKKVLKSTVKKIVNHNMVSVELKPDDPDAEAETSCSETNESDNLSYTLDKSEKCNNNHGIRDSKPRVQLKTRCKEARKRSLHELIIKASKHRGELKKDAGNGKVQTNENAKRCSESNQLENLLGFCCVCGSPVKDKCNHLLDCNRCLIEGLLQCEAEAVDNRDVSFYGRCMHCATSCQLISNCVNLQPGEKLTCARTEGYHGRKREGFLHNHPLDSNGNAGCLVPQEQLNAWLHIHRQKPLRKGRPKLPSSNVQSDCRKAYARYKQLKGWKHLVVHKSGIHALGLYTSQFISRGAMVVEYVGEIVGLRVADQRESEYHSGKKLQYKSACYFFKIDKEHIIDATRKGGIARFVNHSCQPNCVAKVIAVRNEKKVVFFAERDIYPGEEITYDYHFNHEDEGEKIPCYCNSKNCRRYLN